MEGEVNGKGGGEGKGKGKGKGGGEGKGEGKGKGKGKGEGENCCGNSNLDFHPKFLPPPKLSSLYFIFH